MSYTCIIITALITRAQSPPLFQSLAFFGLFWPRGPGKPVTTHYARSLVVGMRTCAYILRFDFIVERMFCCFCGNSLQAYFVNCPTCGASTSSATYCDSLSRRPDNARDKLSLLQWHYYSASGPNKKGSLRPSVARTSQSKAKDDVLINVSLIIVTI